MDKKIYCMSYLAWFITTAFVFLAVIIFYSITMFVIQILTVNNLIYILLMLLVCMAAVLFLGYAVLLFSNLPKIHLELSDEGLIFYGLGYRIYTPWENIAGVSWGLFSRSFPHFIQLKEPAAVGAFSFEEGIASRRAVSEKRHWWMPNRQLKAEAQYTHYIRIPVALLRKKDKKEGSIDQYLQHYVPEMMPMQQ